MFNFQKPDIKPIVPISKLGIHQDILNTLRTPFTSTFCNNDMMLTTIGDIDIMNRSILDENFMKSPQYNFIIYFNSMLKICPLSCLEFDQIAGKDFQHNVIVIILPCQYIDHSNKSIYYPGAIYEIIINKNIYFFIPHTISTNHIDLQHDFQKIVQTIKITLFGSYHERYLKMFDYKFVMYYPFDFSINSTYRNGPYIETLYDYKLNTHKLIQCTEKEISSNFHHFWFEYSARFNQLFFTNSIKQKKKKI